VEVTKVTRHTAGETCMFFWVCTAV